MDELLSRVTVNPDVCHGKPTLRNLRYPVTMVLDLLASGMTPEELLADYPDLEREDINACLAFGAKLADVQRVVLLAA